MKWIFKGKSAQTIFTDTLDQALVVAATESFRTGNAAAVANVLATEGYKPTKNAATVSLACAINNAQYCYEKSEIVSAAHMQICRILRDAGAEVDGKTKKFSAILNSLNPFALLQHGSRDPFRQAMRAHKSHPYFLDFVISEGVSTQSITNAMQDYQYSPSFADPNAIKKIGQKMANISTAALIS